MLKQNNNQKKPTKTIFYKAYVIFTWVLVVTLIVLYAIKWSQTGSFYNFLIGIGLALGCYISLRFVGKNMKKE